MAVAEGNRGRKEGRILLGERTIVRLGECPKTRAWVLSEEGIERVIPRLWYRRHLFS